MKNQKWIKKGAGPQRSVKTNSKGAEYTVVDVWMCVREVCELFLSNKLNKIQKYSY